MMKETNIQTQVMSTIAGDNDESVGKMKKRTGKWLAEQLGKSNCTVSKWCSNVAQPDLHTLERIAQLLEVDKRELLTPSEIK